MTRRRKPIERGEPPKRSTKRIRRGKPPAPISEKTKRRLVERTRVRRAVIARDGGCVARDLVPEIACSGVLDVDERISRRRRPGAQYDESAGQALCRAHHEWKTTHDAEAVALGLSGHSWDA